jgi:hypothetical protein
MLCEPPFQHLGFDARVNGPANALWINGDNRTLSVGALFSLTPPAQAAQGKVPASGLIDATYTQRDGAVDLRRLKLNLPSSQLEAHGHLGAYPTTSLPQSPSTSIRRILESSIPFCATWGWPATARQEPRPCRWLSPGGSIFSMEHGQARSSIRTLPAT